MNEPYFTCSLDLKPIPQGRPRVTRTGRVYYSKPSTAYRRDITYLIRSLFRKPVIITPCSIEFRVNGLRKGADLDNLTKQLMDSLVEARVVDDDSWSTVRSIRIEHDASIPIGVEIKIWLLECSYGKN